MHAMQWPHNATLLYKMHTNCLVTVGLLAIEGENGLFHAMSVHVQKTMHLKVSNSMYVHNILNWLEGVRLSLCMEIYM